MEGKREWEVWNQGLADKLASDWGDPLRKRRGGRHWELVYRVASLVEGESVLDVGCGLGHLYRELSSLDYHGVDVSENMIEKARSFFPEDKAERFQVGDVYDLSSLPMFDSVVSISLLIHLPGDIEDPIQQLWSRTKHHCIFTIRLSPHGIPQVTKTRNYAGIPDKYLVRRIDTVENMYRIFAGLDNLGKIERYFFDFKSAIFKLTRGIKRGKARDYDHWEVMEAAPT